MKKETVYPSESLVFALQIALCYEREHHRLHSTKFYPVSMLSSDTNVCKRQTQNSNNSAVARFDVEEYFDYEMCAFVCLDLRVRKDIQRNTRNVH